MTKYFIFNIFLNVELCNHFKIPQCCTEEAITSISKILKQTRADCLKFAKRVDRHKSLSRKNTDC